MNCWGNLIRWCFISIVLISCVAALVVLGFDIDLLRNGPKYLSMFIFRIYTSKGQTGLTQDDIYSQLQAQLTSLWLHIPMIIIVILCALVIFICFIGLFGACMLSYALLSGYVIFQFSTVVVLLSMVLWLFLNNMQDAVSSAFIQQKMEEYNANSSSSFGMVIDFIQSDLHCCGFSAVDDWAKYPPSCCPTDKAPWCTDLNVYQTPCLQALKTNLLVPGSVSGALGIGLIVSLCILSLNLILSLILCLIVRKGYSKEEPLLQDRSTYPLTHVLNKK